MLRLCLDLKFLYAGNADQSSLEHAKVIGGFAKHTSAGKTPQHDAVALYGEVNEVPVADCKHLAKGHGNDHAAQGVYPPGNPSGPCMFRIIVGNGWHTPNV